MRRLLITLLVLCVVFSVSSDVFTFDLIDKDSEPWDGQSTGVYANDNDGATFSLEATMYAYLDGGYSAGSYLNSTSSDFGINADGTTDASSLFDTNEGAEALWVKFNYAVTIKSIVVSDFSSGVETGAYQVADGSVSQFTDSGEYVINTTLIKDDFFKVIAVDEGTGNGWRMNSFTVEAVPEPATMSMIGIAGALALLVRRRLCV